jgi:hypothetical protein
MQSKLNKKAVTKVQKYTEWLPSNKLFLRYYIQAHRDLVIEFLTLRQQSVILGKCFKARFGGGGGNPAEDALTEGYIDEYERDVIWALVDAFQAIFTLIQMNWNAIKAETSFISESFLSSETTLFFEILREHYDDKFMQCVDGYTFTPAQAKERAKELREQTDLLNLPSLPQTDMSTVDVRKKCGLNYRNKYFYWLNLVLDIGQKQAKKNKSYKKYLDDFHVAVSRVADIYEYWGSQHRTPEDRAKAVKWKDKKKSVGCKGGYQQLYKT